jgi:hypothetical protein
MKYNDGLQGVIFHGKIGEEFTGSLSPPHGEELEGPRPPLVWVQARVVRPTSGFFQFFEKSLRKAGRPTSFFQNFADCPNPGSGGRGWVGRLAKDGFKERNSPACITQITKKSGGRVCQALAIVQEFYACPMSKARPLGQKPDLQVKSLTSRS